jgi:hypothetical protein
MTSTGRLHQKKKKGLRSGVAQVTSVNRRPPEESHHPHRQRLDLARAPSRSARGIYLFIGNSWFDNLLLTPKTIHPGSHRAAWRSETDRIA